MRSALKPQARRRRAGLTLVEIVAVMAIMVLLLSIVTTASIDWGRRTAMWTSLHTLEAGLGLARQFAVAKNRRTFFTYGNTGDPPAQRGMYVITDSAGVLLDNTNFLARGIVFTNDVSESVAFRADGSCRADVGAWSGGHRALVLQEEAREDMGLVRTVRVWRTTGMVEILD